MAVVEHWAEEMTDHTLPHIYDVLIVGAGPCGLAAAARLREHTPSALFTDVEHARYHWMSRKASRLNSERPKQLNGKLPSSRNELSMVVLDSSGSDWLTKWNRHFQDLQISHLRSPMFFHPDPRDRDGLLAYAHEHDRSCDCIEISGCVGKEISKHQKKKQHASGKGRQAIVGPGIDWRDEKDYYVPPSDLFTEYCDCVAGRYGLCGREMIKHETIVDIDFDMYTQLNDVNKLFAVSSNRSLYFARAVVLAVGAGGRPSIPKPFTPASCHCACHAFDAAAKQLLLQVNVNSTILIIGGGLTAAQMADLAVQRGCKVWMLVRGALKVKPFDVDLAWMGKYKNQEKATFWSADTDEERLAMIKKARGGGSITLRYHKILQQHIKTCRLCLHTHTCVSEQAFDLTTETYTVNTEPLIPALPKFDRVCFATGVQSDIGKLPFLRTLRRKEAIETFDGLPALTDELKWKDDVPLFVTGKLAGLRIGPGGGNLEGARIGAERIAWAVEDMFGSGPMQPNSEEGLDFDQRNFAEGIGNRFESLSLD